MKHCSLTILSLFIFCIAHAQSYEGITTVKDTSFNINTEYLKVKKKYPSIRIAAETHSSAIKERYDIRYCRVGERDLVLDAFYPKGKAETKRTAIIMIFGGGWRSGNRTMHYPLAEKLAALGYVCFTPDYRLSTEALYPAAVNDVRSSIRWVRKHASKYNIDTTRICIAGFSAGGELAAFAAVTGNEVASSNDYNYKQSNKVNALIDIDGTLSFVHPESGEGDDSKKRSAASYWFGYTKKENPALWEQASPLTHADKASAPVLFLNSSVERMHAGRNDFIKVLSANNIYTEVRTIDDSPHSFCLFDPWFEPTVKYIDEFLKKVF